MKSIFVSAYNIDKPPASTLINALLAKGITVEHSPSNPHERTDPKWENWYGGELSESIKKCEGFVSVIDETWDSSSWMAEECLVALKQMNVYYWNPNNVKVTAPGMAPFLKSKLPTELIQAVQVLVK
jgi:hypothetical protein